MHPLLFPWSIPSSILLLLAYAAVAVFAGSVALVVAGRGGIRRDPMRVGGAFALTAGVGGYLVATRLADVEAQPLPIHTYGLMIALGFLSAIYLSGRYAQRFASVDPASFYLPGAPALAAASRELKSKGGDLHEIVGRKAKESVLDLALWVFLAALAGSRILFILVNWGGPDGYGAHPGRILQIWVGGFVFYGGFIGATLASIFYARKHRLNFRGLADIAAPTIALGHFFGRMGCMSAGCCWGKVCADPAFVFGAKFPQGSAAYGEMVAEPAFRDYILSHGHTPALHPTQLYEGLGELGLFFILIHLAGRKRFHGQILASWLMLYAIVRLSIETFRGDFGRGMLLRWPEADPLLLSTSQIVGVAMFALGAVLFAMWRPRAASPDPVAPDPRAA